MTNQDDVSDLVSRLLEAIRQVEQDALAVPEEKRVWWGQPGKCVVLDDENWLVVRPVSAYSVQHIARNDPSAVLRRCEAYRGAINRYSMLLERQRRFDDETAVGEKRIVHTRISEAKGMLECIAYGLGLSVEEETTHE